MRVREMLAGARTPPYTVAPLSPSRVPFSLVDEPKTQGIGSESDPPQTVRGIGQGEGEAGCQGEARPEEEARIQEATGEEAGSEGWARHPKGTDHKEVRYGGARGCFEGISAPDSSVWAIGWDQCGHNRHERVW